MIITIDEEFAAQLRAAAEAKGEDVNHYAVATLVEGFAARRQVEEGVKAQAELVGHFTPAKESFAAMRIRHGIPDLSHLTADEIADQSEEILSNLPTEKTAELKRLGLI